MMRRILRWIRWRSRGYRCDRCGAWTSRWWGRAAPRHVTKNVPALGKRLPPVRLTWLELLCPACAGEEAA